MIQEKVVIIVVNFNQPNYTIDCVLSILNSDYKNIHIILIENGSNSDNKLQLDLLLKTIQSECLLVVKNEKNIGYVGGVNQGLKLGLTFNPDYFLILNNDTIIDTVAISELIKACKLLDNKAIVSGKVYDFTYRNKLQYIGSRVANPKMLTYQAIGVNEEDIGQYDLPVEMDMLDDIFWLFPVDLYKTIGNYSPYFWFNSEQADYALRAKKAGYKLYYTPKAKLWHKGSISIGGRIDNPILMFWTIQGKLLFRFFHLKKIYFIVFYIKTLFFALVSVVKNLILFKQKKLKVAVAKLYAIHYFNKWLFFRNENVGFNPYIKN